MPRPTKWRKIEAMPKVIHFAPQHGAGEGENVLKLEELEAIRLKDLEGLEQEECAVHMQVSRPTFQRILVTARQKVADSLIKGKDLRIAGGHFTRQICPVHCLDCGRKWDERLENLEKIKQGEFACPQCHSIRVRCRHRFQDQPNTGPDGCPIKCRRFDQLHDQ